MVDRVVGDGHDDFEKAIAGRQWEDNFGGAVVRHLDPAIPPADLARLDAAGSKIKGYVDRHVAHAQSSAVPAAVTLKIAELHEAIDVIGDVFARYYSLFTASSMIMHDWLAIFRKPWMSDEYAASL